VPAAGRDCTRGSAGYDLATKINVETRSIKFGGNAITPNREAAIQGNVKAMTQDQFVELLAEWFRANKQTSSDLKITADTELLGSGLLDSFDFLDVIVYIENKTGKKIDLSVADPNQFSLVSGLYRLATGGDEGAPTGASDNPVSASV
jgi:acyl carrier protein